MFGTALGAALSIAFPLLGKGLSFVGKGISAVGRKLASKIPHKWLTDVTSKLSGKVTSFIKDHNIHQIHLKNTKLENLLAPKSIYESTKQAIIEVRAEQCGDKFLAKAIVNLPSDKNKNFKLVDKKGNPIKKENLYTNKGEGILKLSDVCDDEVKQKFLEKGITELEINNGVIDFSPVADYKFVSNLGIGPDRDINMKNYYDQLADTWSLDEKVIPQKIQDGLKKMNVKFDEISADDVQKVLSNLQLTPHEDLNNTVYLVDTFIHSKVSHAGGVSYAKTMAEVEMLKEYKKKIYSSTPRAIYGSLITETS